MLGWFPGADPEVRLNPSADTLLEKGDCLVVLAEDDDTYEPAETPFATAARQNAPKPPVNAFCLESLACVRVFHASKS